MQSDEFQQHYPVLAKDQVRHNVMVSSIDRYFAGQSPDLHLWSLGEPGACAVHMPGRSLVLGDLSAAQCSRLAEQTREADYSVVTGPDQTARWFVQRATELGSTFSEEMPQAIHALSHVPAYPDVDGEARFGRPSEDEVLADWLIAFSHEALPDQAPPVRDLVSNLSASRRYVVWDIEGRPVSMACIARRTERTMSISAVYTPPAWRGRGYAGAAVAHLVDLAFAEGKTSACLYTDLRNPYSNRCYARIGFRPVCGASYYVRCGS